MTNSQKLSHHIFLIYQCFIVFNLTVKYQHFMSNLTECWSFNLIHTCNINFSKSHTSSVYSFILCVSGCFYHMLVIVLLTVCIIFTDVQVVTRFCVKRPGKKDGCFWKRSAGGFYFECLCSTDGCNSGRTIMPNIMSICIAIITAAFISNRILH